MATPQRPKRMFKGQERASRYEVDRQPKARMEQMASEHQDVLQNIEFVLVNEHRADPTIDDRHVDAALKTALGGGFAQDSLAKLAGLDRDQRVSAASQLELQLMRGPAPLAAIGTPVIGEFFSARVSCHVFQPLEFGADLGGFCLG